MQRLVSSSTAAARLGVSTATIKRWTAAGLLAVVRTAGGHRRFAEEELARFLRVRGDPDGRVGGWVARLLSDDSPAQLHAFLIADRVAAGSWWQVAVHLQAVDDELRRRSGALTIGGVAGRIAGQRLERAVGRCAEALPPSRGATRVLLVAPEGDPSTLGLALVELCVAEWGWAPRFCGTIPTEAVEADVRRRRVQAVALCGSPGCDVRALAVEARRLSTACRRAGVALAVGGVDAAMLGDTIQLARGPEVLRGWMAEIERAARPGRSAPRRVTGARPRARPSRA